jgi:hypothetical protein
MSKLIRVQDSTHKRLAKYGHWDDTMDTIIDRLLQDARLQKEDHREEVVPAN